jgi:hypothetical protein
LVFITEMKSVYSAVRTGSLNKAVYACATYSINWLVFITEIKSVYSAVRTGDLNEAVCCSSLKDCSTADRKRHTVFTVTVCGQQTPFRDRKVLLPGIPSQTGSGTFPEVVSCNRILRRCHVFFVSPARIPLTKNNRFQSCDEQFGRSVVAIRWSWCHSLLSLTLYIPN